MKHWGVIIVGILTLSFAARAHASDGAELMAAYSQMVSPGLDSAQPLVISKLTIEQRDFKLVLDTGVFCFFTPLTIESDQRSYGGIFIGRGRIQFAPPLRMEQEQLNRFFKSDSLDRPIERALILCDAKTCDQIRAAGILVPNAPQHELKTTLDELQRFLTMREEHAYLFEALRNIAMPRKQGYLLVNTQPVQTSPVFYIFDPYQREEIQFRRHYKEFIVPLYMELICSYSVYADESYVMLNGMNKDQITPGKCTIGATITKGGDFFSTTAIDFTVQMTPTQMVTWNLHERLKIDSICDSSGQKVNYLRYKDNDYRSSELFVILPRPMENGEHGRLTFYYHGDIIKKQVGDFLVDAGASWYPRFGWSCPMTFDITFKTPAEYEFVFSGDATSRRKVKDTLISTWVIDRPTAFASFNLGNIKRYEYTDPDVAPVEVYYNEDLHRASGGGKSMQDQIGSDVIGSMRLFSVYFGKLHTKSMKVSELLYPGGESYPGYINLDPSTFQSTDLWGYDQSFRAHEVAHQWWGLGVDGESYHDTWLSEGFSDYCGLMYVQAASGNDKFLYWIDEYRKNVLSLHKFLLWDRKQAGPITLGYRTSSTKSPTDYGLVIYEKGALVIHMLRNLMLNLETMKEDRFLNMMRDFHATFDGRRATTQDFKAMVEKHIGEDMTWFFDEWVYRSDLPSYKFSYTISQLPEKGYEIKYRIEEEGVPPTFKMYVPIEIDFEAGGKAYIRELVDKPLIEQTISPIMAKPKKVKLNPFQSVLANVKQ